MRSSSPTTFPSLQSVYFFLTLAGSHGTQYITRKPYASRFLTHKSSSPSPSRSPQPYLSIPDPKPEQCGSPRTKLLSPFFGCPPGSFFSWLGPIDRVCVLPTPHHCCVTGGGSQACTIFFVHHRFPSSYLKANIPRRGSFLDLFTVYQMDDISLYAVSR